MNNISLLEESYQKFLKDNMSLPDGILKIDLNYLFKNDLLKFYSPNLQFTRSFYVMETEDKITLLNDEFVVWIVADYFDDLPCTYVLIALNQQIKGPKLEMAFVTAGVYNTSNMVLQILEKVLQDIKDTEEVLLKIV